MPRPGRITPGKRPDTHIIGGCVGFTAGLNGCGKSRLLHVLSGMFVQQNPIPFSSVVGKFSSTFFQFLALW